MRAVSGLTRRAVQLQSQAPSIRQAPGDDTGLSPSLVISPQIRVRHIPYIARHVRRDRTALPPSQKVHTRSRVQMNGVHGQRAREQHPSSIAQKEGVGSGLSLNSAPGPWVGWEAPGEAGQVHELQSVPQGT